MRRSLLLSSLLLVACAASAQLRPVPDGDLFLRVIANKIVVHPEDSLMLKVEVTNVGRDPILLLPDDLCLNPEAGLNLRITDSGGHEIKTATPLTCVPTPSLSDQERFVRVDPDAFYGRVLRLQLSRLLPKPGVYTLEFTLHGTLTRAQAAQMLAPQKRKLVVFTSDCRTLASTFRIEVQP